MSYQDKGAESTPHKISLSVAEHATNSRANFTPGPWTAERRDSEDGGIYYAIHGAGYVFVTNVDEWAYDNPIDLVANAHLIAASPELLVVVQDFVEWLRQPPGSALNVADIKDRALAAIAKATRTE